MSKQICHDSVTLMKAIAKLAGVQEGGFQKMVLVLECDEVPRLYMSGFIRSTPEEFKEGFTDLECAELDNPIHVSDEPVQVDLVGGLVLKPKE